MALALLILSILEKGGPAAMRIIEAWKKPGEMNADETAAYEAYMRETFDSDVNRPDQ